MDIRRRLGVGNSTGLGMAPFFINHPALIHAWINARETALARVRQLPRQRAGYNNKFYKFSRNAPAKCQQLDNRKPHTRLHKTAALRDDLGQLLIYLSQILPPASALPYNAIYLWGARTCRLEGQEQLVSFLLEGHGALVDDLADTMAVDETSTFHIDGRCHRQNKNIFEDSYGWAKRSTLPQNRRESPRLVCLGRKTGTAAWRTV